MNNRLFMFDRVLELVEENQRFWSSIGQHVTRSSPQGQRLLAFFRDAWDPWYARVLLLSARDLDDTNQAILTRNLAQQLVALRDVAGYHYQLSSVTPGGAQDAELAAIEDEASAIAAGLAMNDAAAHQMGRHVEAVQRLARRPVMIRSRGRS